jgi:hypothetical protein
MARLNIPTTHEGAPAAIEPLLDPRLALERSVMGCLLWEDQFYESGVEIADRIGQLVPRCSDAAVARIASDARNREQLRHVPLLLAAHLARARSKLVSALLHEIIQRADEMGEFLAIYAKLNGVDAKHLRGKLSAQVKKGLVAAFGRFDEYQLAKYDRNAPVRLLDVMRLVHPKPAGDGQAALWGRLAKGELKTPDTWETQLSAGANKRQTWERLLAEDKLGYLALLRNLRNIDSVCVSDDLVERALLARKGAWRVLPFRYVAAGRACPKWTTVLDVALKAAIADLRPLPGTTGVLVDVSASMDALLSGKSGMRRVDVAAALAALLPCEGKRIWTFSGRCMEAIGHQEVGPLRLVEVLIGSQLHGGTYLGGAVSHVNAARLDRLVVITDEQSQDAVPDPVALRAYMINVASNQHGVGYGTWTHIDGWSEGVIRYIAAIEGLTSGPSYLERSLARPEAAVGEQAR